MLFNQYLDQLINRFEVFRLERKPEIGGQFRPQILEQFSVFSSFDRFIYSKLGLHKILQMF
jgi:hypothetical protein